MEAFSNVRKSHDQTSTTLMTDRYRSLLSKIYSHSFAYEFTDGDVKRIQTLINELREKISEAKELGEEHRTRILNRLEKLQAELHKRISDLDRFWGLVGDAGTLMAKLGNDAKPMLDRIREIVTIVGSVHARANELPSNTPFKMLSD